MSLNRINICTVRALHWVSIPCGYCSFYIGMKFQMILYVNFAVAVNEQAMDRTWTSRNFLFSTTLNMFRSLIDIGVLLWVNLWLFRICDWNSPISLKLCKNLRSFIVIKSQCYCSFQNALLVWDFISNNLKQSSYNSNKRAAMICLWLDLNYLRYRWVV